MARNGVRTHLIPLLVLASMAVSSVWVASPAVARGDDPLDIPAMLPFVEDVEDVVNPAYEGTMVPYGGTCLSPFGYAREYAAESPEAFQETMEGFGFVQECSRHTGLADLSVSPPWVHVAYLISIQQFEDAEGASDGFAHLYVDNTPYTDFREIDDGVGMGDESRAFTVWYHDSVASYRSIEYAFRIDNLTVLISIRDYMQNETDFEDAQAIADLVEEGMDRVLDGDAPGLALMATHIDESRVPSPSRAIYIMLDGRTEQFGYETEEDYEIRVDGYRNASSIFRMIQPLMRDPAGSDMVYHFEGSLYQFERRRHAREFLEEVPDIYADKPAVMNIEVIEPSVDYGDGAVAIRYEEERPTGIMVFERLFIRIDDIVVDVTFYGPNLPESLPEEVADTQVACVEDDGCSEVVYLPQPLLDIAAASPPGSGASARSEIHRVS